MDIELTPPQTKFYRSTARATCAVAGFGSGKTQVSMFKLISQAIEFPYNDWLYTAPTIPLIRDILWAKLEEYLPSIGIDYHVNKAESIVYLHGLGKIFCRSMENPDRLVGFEVLDAFLDEMDILTTDKALNVFRKVKARCRQKAYTLEKKIHPYKINQQWVTTTPEGFKATYELFKKNPLPDSYLVQMSTYSNRHNLPEGYIEDLRATYPAHLIEAYLMGHFVNLVAAPVWTSYDAESNHVTDVVLRDNEILHIGQDYNVGRGCAVVYVERVLPAKHPYNPTYAMNQINKMIPCIPWKILIAVDEVYNSFDTPDTARVLNERYPKEDYDTRIVYPDSTGKSRKSVNATQSDLLVMKQAGFTIRKSNKNPPIKDRVAAGNASFCNSLNQTKVYVDKIACPNYSDALIQQVYDNNGLPQKGDGKFDDICDAGTYPIAHHFPIKPRGLRLVKTTGI